MSHSGAPSVERRLRPRPLPAAVVHARYHDVRNAVHRLRSAGISLWAPAQILEWSGDARSGRFVHIDATTCALHVGRGSYITLDVQRDLNGVMPHEAAPSMLCRSGAVRAPDARRNLNNY